MDLNLIQSYGKVLESNGAEHEKFLIIKKATQNIPAEEISLWLYDLMG